MIITSTITANKSFHLHFCISLPTEWESDITKILSKLTFNQKYELKTCKHLVWNLKTQAFKTWKNLKPDPFITKNCKRIFSKSEINFHLWICWRPSPFKLFDLRINNEKKTNNLIHNCQMRQTSQGNFGHSENPKEFLILKEL